jgi:hypothetical protein
MYIQQGDVLVKKVQTVSGKSVKTNLLWKGQQHHHRLKGKFKILKDGDRTFVRSNGCTLYHEEHKSLTIPKGDYELGIVQEYDHFDEEARAVID